MPRGACLGLCLQDAVQHLRHLEHRTVVHLRHVGAVTRQFGHQFLHRCTSSATGHDGANRGWA